MQTRHNDGIARDDVVAGGITTRAGKLRPGAGSLFGGRNKPHEVVQVSGNHSAPLELFPSPVVGLGRQALTDD